MKSVPVVLAMLAVLYSLLMLLLVDFTRFRLGQQSGKGFGGGVGVCV